MHEFEAFHEANFEKFCVSVLKHEAANIWKAVIARRNKEIAVGGIEDVAAISPSVEDQMFAVAHTFFVKELPIVVNNEAIADILRFIIPSRRDVLLLTFFTEYTDTQIARILHITCPTVAYRRKAALKQMKELLECRDDEKERY